MYTSNLSPHGEKRFPTAVTTKHEPVAQLKDLISTFQAFLRTSSLTFSHQPGAFLKGGWIRVRFRYLFRKLRDLHPAAFPSSASSSPPNATNTPQLELLSPPHTPFAATIQSTRCSTPSSWALPTSVPPWSTLRYALPQHNPNVNLFMFFCLNPLPPFFFVLESIVYLMLPSSQIFKTFTKYLMKTG